MVPPDWIAPQGPYGCSSWARKLGGRAESGHLDEAERTDGEILAMLQAEPTSPQQQGHVWRSTYHELGMVAQDRGRLDEAADWYAKSLAISEELGDRPGHGGQLPPARHGRAGPGRLDEAADWYRKSLAIDEELGDRPGMASAYHQLGNVARTGAAG